jgi:hypothetical protein
MPFDAWEVGLIETDILIIVESLGQGTALRDLFH